MGKIKVLERSAIRATSLNRPRSFSRKKIRGICLKDVDLSRIKIREKLWWKIVKRTRRMTKKLSISIRRPWERLITVSVHLVALSILALMILHETNDYRDDPTGTAVDDEMYPVQEIDFPAIALCNINILSREKVLNYANELWDMTKVRNIENMTLEKVQSVLKYMGHLYTFTYSESEQGDFKLLHEILINAYGTNYIVPKIMARIIPDCRKSLRYCSWAGAIRSCEELFVPRWTQNGICCTFNYVRWTEGFGGATSEFSFNIKRTRIPGNEYGLRVFLNPNFDDDYYHIMSAKGFKVLAYTPTDYPDGPSGGLKEVIISPGWENFLRIKGTYFYSSPDVINYDKKKRGCLFNTELHNDFEGTYSYSQCVMLCRTRDIHKNCGCVPFFYPYPIDFETSRDCNITDLMCLNTFRNKWWSVQPIIDELKKPGYEDILPHESLECNCLPTCEAIDYSIFHTGSTIRHSDSSLIDFVRNYATENVSEDGVLLNISFESTTIVRLRQDVLYYWYDLMSAYGGLCSLFLGLSILTPVELIYKLCSRKWDEKTKKMKILSPIIDSPAIVGTSKFGEQKIYWKEIMQMRQRY